MNKLIKNLQLSHLKKIEPHELSEVKQGENTYKLVLVVGTRADKISADIHAELREKMRGFETFHEGEEIVRDNEEQSELSRLYEFLPHATLLALNELKEGRLEYHQKADIEEETSIYLKEKNNREN